MDRSSEPPAAFAASPLRCQQLGQIEGQYRNFPRTRHSESWKGDLLRWCSVNSRWSPLDHAGRRTTFEPRSRIQSICKQDCVPVLNPQRPLRISEEIEICVDVVRLPLLDYTHLRMYGRLIFHNSSSSCSADTLELTTGSINKARNANSFEACTAASTASC
jgi:hypothetical protein